MKDLKKVIVFLLLAVCVICMIGGIATLFYVEVESSNFFAVGQILGFGVLGGLEWPKIRDYFK